MSKQGFGQQLSPSEFALLQKGKHGGFIAAYQLYADHVYSRCLHLVCDEEIAADLLQSVFERLLKHRKQLRGAEQLGGWLKTCATNACMAYFRQVKREQALASKIATEQSGRQGDIVNKSPYQDSDVAQLIDKLPLAQRSIVYLHAVQNMKHKDIAKNLDIEEASTRQAYRRAIQKLKSWLGKGS